MEKDKILRNVVSLTAEQLFEEIQQGNITLLDLQATGNLDVAKRKKIADLQTKIAAKDEEAWERARYGNEMILSDYITHYPAGEYVQEAKDKIKYLEEARRQAQAAKQRILDSLRKNPNSKSPDDIIGYLQNGTITRDELYNCGIPDDVIDTIYNINPPKLELGKTPDSIPSGHTEVYFWGIPGSGKTCALAALLSTAHKAGYLSIAPGHNGYDYMTRLKNIFVDENAVLPSPTPMEITQYLPFTLKKANEKFARSVSLIELSGEIFQCFYYKNAGKEFPSQSHLDTFNALNNFLKGNNRKIHFFFIDYDKNNKQDVSGYTQSDYLEAASSYFSKHPEFKVFDKSTDAIYIVLTKSDLMPCSVNERVAKAKEHLQKENFTAFVNTLKDNCRKHSINAGKLMIEPFSLGKVYFQQICDFDNTAATTIIDILLERIAPSKKSILDVFNK
jgi:hypothetical protein